MTAVLLTSYSGAWGGAEQILLDFSAGLQGEVVLACPEGELAVRARARGVPVLALRRRSLRWRGSRRIALRALLDIGGHRQEVLRLTRDLDPDLVVAWGMRSAVATLLPRRPQRPVAFQHNDLLPAGIAAAGIRRAARRSDLVLALSHAVARDLDPEAKLGPRLRVVHPGVDPERFAAGRVSAAPVVLLLGALVPWKRPELALEIAALARRQLPALQLWVAGAALPGEADSLLGRLRRRAAAADLRGAVRFLGAVPDPAAVLSGAGCLLHCALAEPFGLALVEALAAGVPVVAPAAAGPMEIVDSGCGRLYPPGEAEAAAAALVDVLRLPQERRRLGRAGRRRVQERFRLPDRQAQWRSEIQRVRRPPAHRTAAPTQATVVTVAHDSAAELERLLASLARHLPGTPAVVVDSGSTDNSLEVAARAGAAVLDPGANLGFAAGCNAGLAAVRTPVAMLLNPDVELVDNSLLELVAAVLAPAGHRRLLAPLVLLGDGRRQDNVHPPPTSGSDLLRAVVPPAAVPQRLAPKLAPWRARRPRPVGWAVGCALVAATGTLRELGPFDERFFLYGEDLELGLRAAAAGVETWFWPHARVLHRRGHSTEREFGGEAYELLAQTRHQAVARALGGRRAAVDDWAQMLTFASRVMLRVLLGHGTNRERRQLQAARRANNA